MGYVTAKYSRKKWSVTRALYQNDYGQTLKFDEEFGIGDTVEVHFGNKGDAETIVKFGNARGVKIPDQLLKTGKDIDAWVFHHDCRCNGESVYHVIIPVVQRGRIEGETDDKPVTYIFDGGVAEDNIPGGCYPGEYIFDGRDSSSDP